MAKSKLSKCFELFGEHLLPLQKCESGEDAGTIKVKSSRSTCRASCGRRLKFERRDVSDYQIRYSFTTFFSSASVLFSWKNDLLPIYTLISRRAQNSGYFRPSHPTPKLKVRYENTLRWPVFELNPSTGELLRSTTSLESTKLDALLNAGPVRCAAVDFEYTHLATVGDDKRLRVWAVEKLQLLSERYAPKRPCRFRIFLTHD